jgi:tetratricopeptide (TPR) repeat protein
MRLRLFLSISLLALVCACSTPRIDLAAWRESQLCPLISEGDAPAALQRFEELRSADSLAEARSAALAAAAARPDDPQALLAASIAESDAMLLQKEDDKHARNHCAASALDYAERALERGASGARAQAQLAWSLGLTTHLQPMSDRSAHARKTLEAVARALEADPDEPTALATCALVHLRLQTLPWIAKLMASDLPDSSLEGAERCASRAVAVRRSRENRSILAKVLLASGRDNEARTVIDAALAAPPTYPRDHALAEALRGLRP